MKKIKICISYLKETIIFQFLVFQFHFVFNFDFEKKKKKIENISRKKVKLSQNKKNNKKNNRKKIRIRKVNGSYYLYKRRIRKYFIN